MRKVEDERAAALQKEVEEAKAREAAMEEKLEEAVRGVKELSAQLLDAF